VGKKWDKRIVIENVIIQKNTYNNKTFSLFGKSSGHIPLASKPGIDTYIWGFLEKGAASLFGELCGGDS
jgi:hypothetical protein